MRALDLISAEAPRPLKCYLPEADTLLMSVLASIPVEVRLKRPPTVVYPDRDSVGRFRELEFPATAAGAGCVVFQLNLEGGFFGTGSLKDLVFPVAQGVRSGVYGRAVLVIVTSDDGVTDFLAALANQHDLSFFILSSPEAPLSSAEPVGRLTSTDVETFNILREAGGEVTSSHLADLAGIEVNAAANRLRGLQDKGVVHRVSRPRPEGDAFVDLLAAAEHQMTQLAQLSAEPLAIPAAGAFDLPADIQASVQEFAALQGSAPGSMLIKAWQEFIGRHRETLEEESELVGKLIQEGDTEGLATYANKYVRERAEEAASNPDS